MPYALLLSVLTVLPSPEPGSASPREEAARILQQTLAPTKRGGEPRLAALLASGEAAVAALESGAVAEALEEVILHARWRAVLDPALARQELVEDLRLASEDLAFSPLIEAGMPTGFPSPTPVRDIELKEYPAYRMVRASMERSTSTGTFWKLFTHIEKHDIAMTTPVETTYGKARGPLNETEMAFLYGSPQLGQPGRDGAVEVVDAEATLVVSIGCRGRMSEESIAVARARILDWMEARADLEVAGELRTMGYNSPMVPSSKRYFEVQLPVRKVERPSPPKLVLDFNDPNEARRWAVVNDTVMGGLSSSRIRALDEGTVVFQGRVSLDNNGGFASVRRRPAAMELEGARALRLYFRGDGNDYKLRVRTDGAYDGVNYQVGFSTEKGVWSERSFPIEDFVPVWRGRRVPGAPPLDPARVQSVGFLISDKQEGSFRLEIAALAVE